MIVVLWLACAAITALIGKWKGRPFLGLLLGLGLPVVGILVILVTPARPAPHRPGSGRPGYADRCPWCRERIPADQKICSHCFQRVTRADPAPR